jgi:hypothetical protein
VAKTHKIFYQGAPIGSIESLAKTLDIPSLRLISIAKSIPSQYTEFEKQVKNKLRQLAEPNRDLKILQKRIITRIFSNLRFPPYLHGGIKSEPSRDFVTNAQVHAGAESAIALDIKNFFPSVTYKHVEDVFKFLFKFPPEVAKYLACLTTLNGSLPQGAPTSSYIANLIMFAEEYKLVAKFEGKKFVYSRLIDDITVSSKKPFSEKEKNMVTGDIFRLVQSYGFEIHPTKKYFFTRKNPHQLMTITGLWLNRGTPRIGRTRRDEISNEVIELRNEALLPNGRCTSKYHDDYNSVSGKVALLTRMNHKEAWRLRSILESITPIYDATGEAKIKKLVYTFCKKPQNLKSLGYIKVYYRLQNSIFIVKRTNKSLGKTLQNLISKRKPETTLKELHE